MPSMSVTYMSSVVLLGQCSSVLTSEAVSRLDHRYCDARPLPRQLHWHPVRQRIFYKTAVLARRANTTGVPAYLKEHLVQRVPSRQTRSAALPLLSVPRLTTDFARRSFSYAAPVIWNRLPTEVMLCDSKHSFKRHLKTFLFNCCHQTV